MIRVTDNYCIDLDTFGYTVMRDEHRMYFDKKSGKDKPFYTNLAYYGKIEYAVKYVAEQMFRDKISASPTDVPLAEAIKEFQKAYKYVAETVEKNIP